MTQSSMEESSAIARLKRGDLAGLDALMLRYQLQAVRAAYLIVRDRPQAEEIVQNAFVRLVHKVGQFDANRPFGPWFLRGVINDALQFLRKQKRQVSLDDVTTDETSALVAYLTDPQPNPEALTVDAETCREVWDALGQLSPSQRAAIVQRYYLGLSEAEMSAALQRPAGTVKWLLHSARQRLHRLLAPTDASEKDGEL